MHEVLDFWRLKDMPWSNDTLSYVLYAAEEEARWAGSMYIQGFLTESAPSRPDTIVRLRGPIMITDISDVPDHHGDTREMDLDW